MRSKRSRDGRDMYVEGKEDAGGGMDGGSQQENK